MDGELPERVRTTAPLWPTTLWPMSDMAIVFTMLLSAATSQPMLPLTHMTSSASASASASASDHTELA
jgi:hypothetical protein